MIMTVRSPRVAPVAAVAFGVLTLGVGLSRVPLDGVIDQAGLGGSVAEPPRCSRSRSRWRSPPPRWSPRRCSIRCAAGCSTALTAGSTGPAINAEAVVAAFHTRLRQTIDLDTVRDDLVGTVHQAFEPAHVSVWLAAANSAEQS